jgi:hypothetical protein
MMKKKVVLGSKNSLAYFVRELLMMKLGWTNTLAFLSENLE